MKEAGSEQPSRESERALAGCGRSLIAGVDEAGRGPWAGPVVAAAVIFRREDIPPGLNDSKKLTAGRREELFEVIREAAYVQASVVCVGDIDRLNILHASMLAMKQAVEGLEMAPEIVLVDGNRAPDLAQRTIPVIGGDAICPSIAAASIVAKVTRDRLMQELSSDFPAYGWHQNKGYGTRAHAEAIAAYGVTCHHRRSFAPVRAALAASPAS